MGALWARQTFVNASFPLEPTKVQRAIYTMWLQVQTESFSLRTLLIAEYIKSLSAVISRIIKNFQHMCCSERIINLCI